MLSRALSWVRLLLGILHFSSDWLPRFIYSRDVKEGGLTVTYLRHVYRLLDRRRSILDRSQSFITAEFSLVGFSMLGKGPSVMDDFHIRLNAPPSRKIEALIFPHGLRLLSWLKLRATRLKGDWDPRNCGRGMEQHTRLKGDWLPRSCCRTMEQHRLTNYEVGS